MVDPVATTVALLLAKSALESAGGQVGESVWRVLTRLGDIVQRQCQEGSDDEETLSRALAAPEDPAAVERLAHLVQEIMESDPEFRNLVAELAEVPLSAHPVFKTTVLSGGSVEKLVNVGNVYGDVQL
ncbi:hypothetical protein [Frankia sp. CiP3]|uniref:hypothetical protein n=1 Tax=Frankia sp. CiP3 TaxID=2880971 RepID=UPI001EF72F83|nr:hypothetical protein [Frankia sp. CiP3]